MIRVENWNKCVKTTRYHFLPKEVADVRHNRRRNGLLTFYLLTYMATILSALREGVLDEFALPDWELREPLRPLLVAPELVDWVDSREDLHKVSAGRSSRSPYEHLVQAFCDLRCAERPGAGDLRRLTPTTYGVWKLHPPLLRVYGWFHQPLRFIAVTAAFESETKTDKKLNDRKRDEVRAFIAKHHLGDTVLSGDHRAILQPQAR